MKRLKKIFHRKKKDTTEPLRISGVGEAPLTPEPDDAELMTQALLDNLSKPRRHGRWSSFPFFRKKKSSEEKGSAGYYRQLASRVKEDRLLAADSARRYVAYCEAHINDASIEASVLSSGLFRHQDAVEREGGELYKRWQRCVAEVTVRQLCDTRPSHGQKEQI